MAGSRTSRFKRRRILIEPKVQLLFTMLFLFVVLTFVLIQTLVLQFMLSRVASSMPNDGIWLKEALPSIVFGSYLSTAFLLTPITLIVGAYTTFKFVGPLHRFRIYLRQLKDGEKPRPCKIRDGDQLQDFCVLLNEATAPLREDAPPKSEEPAVEPEPAVVGAP